MKIIHYVVIYEFNFFDTVKQETTNAEYILFLRQKERSLRFCFNNKMPVLNKLIKK